jgi:hypothetical protein
MLAAIYARKSTDQIVIQEPVSDTVLSPIWN